MIITLTGPNDLLRHQELDNLTLQFTEKHGSMALEKLDGEDDSTAKMLQSVQSLPFLSSKKMVVFRHPSKQKDFVDVLPDIIKGADETTDVIIYESKIDKRSLYYKALRRASDFREFNQLDTGALARWVQTYAKEQGGSINASAAMLLVQTVGSDQLLVKNELDKLLAYNLAISPENVRLLCEPSLQSTVFDLLESAFSGNKQRAIKLYKEQRAQKVEPQKLVGMLAWQLHILALVKSEGNKPADQIASAAKASPFVIQKAQAITRKLSMAQIKSLIADLLKLDLTVKRSSIDIDEALELYLLKLGK